MSKEKPCPLVPVQDKLIVRPDEANKMSAGGIALPENAQKKPQRGTVLAVGPGEFCPELAVAAIQEGDLDGQYTPDAYVPMHLNVGDVVWWAWGSGWEVEAGGETLLVLQECDVLCTE